MISKNFDIDIYVYKGNLVLYTIDYKILDKCVEVYD